MGPSLKRATIRGEPSQHRAVHAGRQFSAVWTAVSCFVHGAAAWPSLPRGVVGATEPFKHHDEREFPKAGENQKTSKGKEAVHTHTHTQRDTQRDRDTRKRQRERDTDMNVHLLPAGFSQHTDSSDLRWRLPNAPSLPKSRFLHLSQRTQHRTMKEEREIHQKKNAGNTDTHK